MISGGSSIVLMGGSLGFACAVSASGAWDWVWDERVESARVRFLLFVGWVRGVWVC